MMSLKRSFEIYWMMFFLGAIVTFPCVFLRTKLYKSTIHLSNAYQEKKQLSREVASLRALYESRKVKTFQTQSIPFFKRCDTP
jgi:hypothetical protein